MQRNKVMSVKKNTIRLYFDGIDVPNTGYIAKEDYFELKKAIEYGYDHKYENSFKKKGLEKITSGYYEDEACQERSLDRLNKFKKSLCPYVLALFESGLREQLAKWLDYKGVHDRCSLKCLLKEELNSRRGRNNAEHISILAKIDLSEIEGEGQIHTVQECIEILKSEGYQVSKDF